jgi:Kef-type K+ transport system membrane component KefB
MDMARIFGFPTALLVIAVAANRLSRWTRVPDIIVLLLIGVGLGPVLKWVDPSHFEGDNPHSRDAGADPPMSEALNFVSRTLFDIRPAVSSSRLSAMDSPLGSSP